MDFNIEVRKKQLDNLDQLISSSRDRIESVLDYLGWTAEKVQKEENLVTCSINPSHKLPVESWNKHIEKCVLRAEGYDLKDQFLSESSDNTVHTIYLDQNKKIEIIREELIKRGGLKLAWNGIDPDPRTADRMMSTYSSDERLAFYNYCVQNTAQPPPPPEFTTLTSKKHDSEKPITFEEQLAQERDAKRRRTKYKSVHINRKNHTEVIREVINRQMEDYKEWLLAKEQKIKKLNIVEDCNDSDLIDDKKEDLERPHSSISRNSTQSGSSRSTSRKHDKREQSEERYHYHRSRYDNRDRSRNRHMSHERNSNRSHSNGRRHSRESKHHSRENKIRREYDSDRKHR